MPRKKKQKISNVSHNHNEISIRTDDENMGSDQNTFENLDAFDDRNKSNENVFTLKEGKDYYCYDDKEPSVFKYIRQLKVKKVQKRSRKDSQMKYCNYICLLCHADKTMGYNRGFILFGDFMETKSTTIQISNFVTHLKSSHQIILENEVDSNKSEMKENLCSAIAKYISYNGLPLNTVNKETFKNMLQCARNDFNASIPGRRAIGNSISTLYNTFLDMIKLEISPLLQLPVTESDYSLPVIHIMSDAMTSNSNHYHGFGISYLTKNLIYREVSLFLIGSQESSASAIFSNQIKNKLHERFGIEAKHVSMMISDNAAAALNISKELIDCNSNRCMMHLLGLVVTNLINNPDYEIANTITDVKALCVYFSCSKRMLGLKRLIKKHGFNDNMKLRPYVNTRPLTVIQMMQSIMKIKPAILEYFQHSECPAELNWEDIIELEALLSPMMSWFQLVQTNKRPMLSLNSITYIILQKDYEECVEIFDMNEYFKQNVTNAVYQEKRKRLK